MSNPLQYKLSTWLHAEFDRLEGGNRLERQRYNNAQTAIVKVLSNPLHSDFKKDLPENFKAVDILQQYRLFFRIEKNPTTQEDEIFFVWMNDDESLHRTGKPDDCYQVFREMLNRSEIERYLPDPEASDQYKRHEEWGSSVIYLSYKNLIKSEPPFRQYADAHLHLNVIVPGEYAIQSVTVSHENEGLATRLLENLCRDVDQYKITLVHELFVNAEHSNKSRHLLQKFSFEMIDCIDGVEVWQRKK